MFCGFHLPVNCGCHLFTGWTASSQTRCSGTGTTTVTHDVRPGTSNCAVMQTGPRRAFHQPGIFLAHNFTNRNSEERLFHACSHKTFFGLQRESLSFAGSKRQTRAEGRLHNIASLHCWIHKLHLRKITFTFPSNQFSGRVSLFKAFSLYCVNISFSLCPFQVVSPVSEKAGTQNFVAARIVSGTLNIKSPDH